MDHGASLSACRRLELWGTSESASDGAMGRGLSGFAASGFARARRVRQLITCDPLLAPIGSLQDCLRRALQLLGRGLVLVHAAGDSALSKRIARLVANFGL